MDPYLEHPDFFAGLHGDMITYLKEFIQPRLPPHYLAKTNERVWMEISNRTIEPDVEVLAESNYRPAGLGEADSDLSAATATATAPVVITVRGDDEEFREAYLDIFAGEGTERRLVASVEVLSRSNKAWGSDGWFLYRKKQEEMLKSRVHFIEIDLLRWGEHTTAIPYRLLKRRVPRFDYHICIHCFDRPRDFLVHPILLSSPLPALSIPLLPGDPPVVVDLAAVFNRCYETGGYERVVDYHATPPAPPLVPEMAAWVEDLLRAKRKRAQA
jgi:hypothetical protein